MKVLVINCGSSSLKYQLTYSCSRSSSIPSSRASAWIFRCCAVVTLFMTPSYSAGSESSSRFVSYQKVSSFFRVPPTERIVFSS